MSASVEVVVKYITCNWKKLVLGGLVTSVSGTIVLYLSFVRFRKTYPCFVSLPGPFKHIGMSSHRIPNSIRFKIYYPTSLSNVRTTNSKPPSTYFTDWQSLIPINMAFKIPMFVLDALNNLRHALHPMPCFENAPIEKRNSDKFPLLLFSHGNFASFDTYVQICCGLASYGIVVAICEHTDGSALYTKLPDGQELYIQGKHLLNGFGEKYVPNPWTLEHDVADYGEQRLKAVRVPEFLDFFRYLVDLDTLSGNSGNDERLNEILKATDCENIIFGGQSFGGITSWMASTQMEKHDEHRLKCLVLLDPYFGCLNVEELETMKWSKPGLFLSSEVWIKEKRNFTKCTQTVMRQGLHKQSVWEYGEKFTHFDSADVPIWGPSWMTGCRKMLTAQQWSDLICKRCASFIAGFIPSFKQRINHDCLAYDQRLVHDVVLP